MANEFKIKKGLIVTGASGGTVVDIQGSQGQLFSVTDDLSGSIFAVSDISGVPILDVNSSGLSTFNGNVLVGSDSSLLLSNNATVSAYAGTNDSLYLNSKGSGIVRVNFSGGTGGFEVFDGATTSLFDVSSAGNGTFAGQVTATEFYVVNNNFGLDTSGNYLEILGYDGFKFRNSQFNAVSLTIEDDADATFATQAFATTATSSGDASSTLTTKGYVDGLITGATIYRGAWQAGISATSSAATTASTTLTVTAAILDADGNTPVLVGAVVTGAGITGIVKVASVTSSTVYVLDTAITATATAYIFSPIYGAPDLSGVTETSGYYYICSEAGSATPNGANSEPNTWAVGDWCIYNDVSGTGQWQKIDNSSVLSGAGTGQTVALWEGPSSVTDSDTLGNAPITVSGTATTFGGDVLIPEYLYHSGDTNTYIRFTADTQTFRTGGDDRLILTNSLATLSEPLLIDGVLNYTGLEIKGTGASRPAVNFTNVTQGDLGSIFGTEGNALAFATNGGAASLTLDSSQNATFAGNVNVNGALSSVGYSGTSGTFSASVTASGNSNSFGNTTTAALYATSGTFSSSVTAAGNSNSFGSTTVTSNLTTNGVFTIQNAAPYIQWKNVAGTRLSYIQHNATNLVVSADTGQIQLDTAADNDILINPGGTGKVGIGTTSPATTLEVMGAIPAANRTVPLDILTITGEGSNLPYTGSGGGIVFKNRTYTYGLLKSARIRSYIDADSGSNRGAGLVFEVTNLNQTYNPSLFLKYNGNVGIGTTTPRPVGSGYKALEIGSPSSGSSLWLSGFSDTTKGYLAMDTGGLNLTAISNHSLTFGTNNSPKMTILSGGNVGIGVTGPVNKIQANYAPVAIASLTASAGTASTNWNRNAFLMGTGASVSNALAFGVSGTANDRKAWIQSGHPDSAANSLGIISLNPLGGNVGIGNTSPDAKLDVNGNVIITTSGAVNNLLLTSTDTTTAGAPDIVLYANAPAVTGDTMGDILFQGQNGMVPTSTSPLTYTGLFSKMVDKDNNHSSLVITTHKGNGSGAQALTATLSAKGVNNSATGTLLINPSSVTDVADYNLEVKGDALIQDNFYVNGNVGIGTTSPLAKLDIQGTQGQLFSVTDNLSGSIFAVADISGVPILDVNSNGTIQFSDLGAGTLVTDASGNITASTTAGTVTGSGTDNTVPLWNGTTGLNNSVITQTSVGAISINETSPANATEFNIKALPSYCSMRMKGAAGSGADIAFLDNLTYLAGIVGVPGGSLQFKTSTNIASNGLALSLNNIQEARFYGSGINGTMENPISFTTNDSGINQENRIRSSVSQTRASNILKFETATNTVGTFNENQLVLNGMGTVGINTDTMTGVFNIEVPMLSGGVGSDFRINGGSGYGMRNVSVEIPGYGSGIKIYSPSSSSVDNGAMIFYQQTSNVGSITINTSSTSFNTTSDYRLKENREDISDAIERVKELKPIKFNWIKEPGESKVDGFYAHELAEVVPEAVTGEKDALDWEGNPEYQSIDQAKIVPLLTAALQQAIDKIEVLEVKIQILENK